MFQAARKVPVVYSFPWIWSLTQTIRGERGAVWYGFSIKLQLVPLGAVFICVKPYVAVFLRYGFAVYFCGCGLQRCGFDFKPQIQKAAHNTNLLKDWTLTLLNSTDQPIRAFMRRVLWALNSIVSTSNPLTN